METTYKMKITCNGDFMYIMEVIYNRNYIWKTNFPHILFLLILLSYFPLKRLIIKDL